jgi:soluble lytic murein transglycosylase
MKLLKNSILICIGVMLLLFLLEEFWRSRREHRYDAQILTAARKYGVDPALVKAVIWQESRFDAHARGGKGEIGLMQIMPDTALDWAGAQKIANVPDFILADPTRNIDCGTWFLGKLLKRYSKVDDPVPYALADYNAGRGNLLKWLKGTASTNSTDFVAQIGFPATRKYVQSVVKRREKYIAWAKTERR